MRRRYIDVSHFRSPYDSPMLQLTGLGLRGLAGLGAASLPTTWPKGRGYVDVSHFRAPYDQGYFQDNDLFGLGADVPAAPAPPATAPAPPATAPGHAYEGALDLVWGSASLIFIGAVLGLGFGIGRQLSKRLIPAGQ